MRGNVLLGDFGLARYKSDDKEMTNPVITRDYRPAELIFGQKKYGTEIDIWSLGITFVEMMMNGERFFKCKCDLELLSKIYRFFGTPEVKDRIDRARAGVHTNTTRIRILERNIS